MAKIYIAASSYDVARTVGWKLRLQEASIECTSMWMKGVTQRGANPENSTAEEQRYWSSTDLFNVDAADLVWFLLPNTAHSHGAFFEFGYAIAKGKPVIVSGQPEWRSIFLAQAYRHFTKDSEAYDYLLKTNELAILRREPEIMERPRRTTLRG